MTRRDDRKEPTEARAQAPVRLDEERLFARMGRGGDDDRPRADRRLHGRELLPVDRRGRHVELEVAGRAYPRRAQFGIAFSVALRLREAEVEPREQRRDRARQETPASVRALRE